MRSAAVVAIAIAAVASLVLSSLPTRAGAQVVAERMQGGRFTVVAYPPDRALGRSLLAAAQANDTFPGLPRPKAAVEISMARDDAHFRELTGDGFPEWGAAAAFPSSQRIVMHGRRAGSDAGNPIVVLRHELAHLALGEAMGDLAPRWFDEGYASYAAGEWGREDVLTTSVALVFGGPRTFAALDSSFYGGSTSAAGAYALAHRAIAELAAMDPARGLSLFFADWRTSGSMDVAVRQAYGVSLDRFEERWRSRTMLRYGVLAVVADLTVVAGVIGVVVLPAYVGRRRRQRKRLETLRINEAEQERRARESALDAMLTGSAAARDGTPPEDLLDTPKDRL